MTRDRVAGIVLKDDQVLLMFRRNKGKEYFTFPGGGIESGETREQALKRELLEETSVEVSNHKLLYSVDWDSTSHQYFYLCDHLKGEPALGDFIEKEVMEKDKSQYYEPCWRKLKDLRHLIVYPLEVKDVFLKDLETKWPEKERTLYLKLSTCRQTL
jgi:8-oxo-dGTP diphosphatase